MSIANLSNILNIFRGSEPSPEEHRQVFKEVLLMTLARASHSDANVQTVEVETVQTILQRVTGEEISVADIRVAASSELYETAPLDSYLAKAGRVLNSTDRVTIVQSLAEVIKSDVDVSSSETEFFDRVAVALKLTPSELAGLTV